MFSKIKEFISAFKTAYNTISIDKINAKKAIDDFKREVDDFVYITDALKYIFVKLETAYSYFPIKERQDFIQKTLDLLRYGRKDDNGSLKDICGWYSLYRSKAEHLNLKLQWLNELYKEGKYGEVITSAKECNEYLEEFYILYGIDEDQNKNNE